MDSYALLVFLHVLGAVGMFAAWGIEAVTLGQLRQAGTVEQARASMQFRRRSATLGPIAMLTALVTGIWMMVARWSHQPWTAVALAGLILIVIVGVAFGRRAMPRIVASLAEGTERLTPDARAAGEILALSLRLRIAIGVAIVALMTIKPGALASLAIMGIAIVIGLGTGLQATRRREAAPAAS